MTTLAEVRERLKVLAEAATPGPWYDDDAIKGDGRVVMGDGTRVALCHTTNSNDHAADAAYIAAADPQTILALLAEVDRLKALYGRYINHVYEREGVDFLSPVHARGVFTDSEIDELREAANNQERIR